jgi:hypothetical protein
MAQIDTIFDELKNYLKKEIRQHQLAAQWKSALAQLLFLIVILTSGLGLINTATNWFNKEGLSALAVIPGIILLISNTFKYEARAKWHKLKQRKLERLCNKLTYEKATVEEISREMSESLEELDKIRVELEKPITK